MAEGDIGAVIDSLEFEAGAATYPKILHVVGDVFAIAYTGPDSDGWIKTVSIDSAGAVSNAVLGSLKFEAGAANNIDFIKIDSNTFAVVYIDNEADGWIRTVNISADGITIALTGSSLEFETVACYEPSIVHVVGDVFAIAYRDSGVLGQLKTFTITGAGAVAAISGGTLEFDSVRCVRPHIIHVVGIKYAIAYEGSGDDGYVLTVNISNDGETLSLTGSSLEFDTADIVNAHILRISASIYVITYKNSDGDGDLVTISINAAGTIGATILDDQEFDAFNGIDPKIIHVSGDFFAIAYEGGSEDGHLRTWSIAADGTINATEQGNLEFDTAYGRFTAILHVSGNIYAIAYTSGAAGGKVISLDIETVAVSAATQHLMMMGIG
jgi:hypothetical protein